MNKKLIFSVMLVCLLAFSLVLSSCGNRLSGTWEWKDEYRDSILTLKFSGKNYTMTLDTEEFQKGTYSITGDKLELAPSELVNPNGQKSAPPDGYKSEWSFSRTDNTIKPNDESSRIIFTRKK